MTFLETYRISIIRETCREKNIFGFFDFILFLYFLKFSIFVFCFCWFFKFCILFFQKYLQRSFLKDNFQEDSRRRSSSSGVRLRIPIRRTKSSNLSFGRALVNRSASWYSVFTKNNSTVPSSTCSLMKW